MSTAGLNVSASEASKGGVKYEVVLSNPVVATPPRSISPTNVPKTFVSVEKIQLKLEQAAERRQSLESLKLAGLQDRFKKVDEVAKKRQEEEINFINGVKENLEHKLEAAIGNRESIISDLKEKLHKHHTNHLQEVRNNLEQSLTEFEEKAKEELEKKLEAAKQNRETVINSKLESLKKHEEKVEQVRNLKRNSSVMDDGIGLENDN